VADAAGVGHPAGADVAKGLTSSDAAEAAGPDDGGSLDESLGCKARDPRCQDASWAAAAGLGQSGCAGRQSTAPRWPC